MHAAQTQKRFEGEKETNIHIKFMEPFDENHDKFIIDMARLEREGIYEYAIEPLGHQSQPRNGEVLNVKTNNGHSSTP